MSTQTQRTVGDELRWAVEAVGLAGRVCKWVQQHPMGVGRVEKVDGSPVTVGDFAAQAVVARVLAERLGVGLAMVSEEDSAFLRQEAGGGTLRRVVEVLRQSGVWIDATGEGVIGAIDRGAGKRVPGPTRVGERHGAFWTLDPIDGTKGFVRGQQFAVCLAKVVDAQPRVAAVACPNLCADAARGVEVVAEDAGIVVAAEEGSERGVWCVVPGGEQAEVWAWTWVKREMLKDDDVSRLVRSGERGHSDRAGMERIIEGMGRVKVDQEADGQCKYAMVALGRADLYLRVPPRTGYRENVWDHAPGVMLVRRAGCVATDIRGRELEFDGVKLERTNGIIAGEPGTHARALRAAMELGIRGAD
ncbi:MAG: 3'(2'),5'-bisphosphate nucleotidase [Phycisphaerales bacterium]|nr:3'(2'),5'-bisphosphate nucleotidase [Phycisphaerales bacterium]